MLLNTIKNLTRDIEVTSNMVQKGNTTLTGITIGNGVMRPTVYMEHYEDVFERDGYEAVAREMIKVCKEASKHEELDVKEMLSWDYAKDNMLLCIAPKGINDGYVTIPYLDLELYFRVIVSLQEDGAGSYKVNESMLYTWNVTTEDLLTVTETNEYIAESMREMMIAMMEEDGMPRKMLEALLDTSTPDQTVVSNKHKFYGAAVLYNKDLLKEVADKYESDLYIIPSSIHELIATPIFNESTVEDMSTMVKEVNETQVASEEVLSNHVYVFHRDTMEIDW